MSTNEISKLQQRWQEYFKMHDKSEPAIHLLSSMKLSTFENDRSFFSHKQNIYYNNFKFLYEFTLSINHIKLPLRFELQNSYKSDVKIKTDQLKLIYLTDAPIFEVSMNGYHVFFSTLVRQETIAINMDILFIVADYLEYSRAVLYQLHPGDSWRASKQCFYDDKIKYFQTFLKLDQMSRDIFANFVDIIFKWSTNEQVTQFRINHLQTLKKEFDSTDIDSLRKEYSQNK